MKFYMYHRIRLATSAGVGRKAGDEESKGKVKRAHRRARESTFSFYPAAGRNRNQAIHFLFPPDCSVGSNRKSLPVLCSNSVIEVKQKLKS